MSEYLIGKLLNGTLNHYGNELGEKHGRLFSFLFDRIFDRIRIEPEKADKLRYFSERGRLIYALPYRSPLDFLFLNSRLRFSGLPMPEIAYNMNVYRFQPLRHVLKVGLARIIHLLRYRVWPNPFKNKYYLQRFREDAGFVLGLEDPASFSRRLVSPIHDPVYHLLKLYRKHGDTVIIIPIFPVFEKGPHREGKSIWDIFMGAKNRPGRLRKIVHYLRFNSQAFLEVGDPVTIERFLEREDQQGLTDEEVSFNIRKELWEHATREQRVIRGPKIKPRTQIMETVLRDPEVIKAMRQDSKRKGKPFRKVRKTAAKYADEIAANYSQSTIEFLNRVLGWVWNNLYEGMQVDEQSLARVREAAKRYPLVYVPSHKSHIDYLVLSWVLYNRNMVPPHIVAGVNLNTWPIGPIFRKAGAFFMRRSFRENPLYAAVFVKYIEVLVREGYNIEFFIEGGRSRTGRLLMPTFGMVKYIYEAYNHNAAQDIMFVPVYIGYDQILEEGEYVEEMSGTKKAASNLGGVFKSRSLIKRRYGRIYVNFGEPVSTREYVEALSDENTESEDLQKVTVQSLAESIIQSINRNQVVTPFSLMAAALLTSPHKAISYSELLNALALFYQYLEEAGARFAETLDNFTRATQDVIACYQHRNLIDVEEGEETEEALFALPEDNRLSLEMYKNMILHHFLPISFVSLSLLSADYGECMENKVREDYTVLKDLLKHDFVYDDREDDGEWIEKCLQFLEKGRHLQVSSIDGTSKYTVTSKGREEMVYFAAMLTNFLEAYGILLNTVPRLGDKPETEKEFLQRLRKTGQRLYKQGQVMRPEALSQLIYKNALQYVREQNMVIQQEQNKGKPLLIMDTSKENLRNELLTHISKFIRVEKYHYLSR